MQSPRDVRSCGLKPTLREFAAAGCLLHLTWITRAVKSQEAEIFGARRGGSRFRPAFDADGGDDACDSQGPTGAPLRQEGSQFLQRYGHFHAPARIVPIDGHEPARIPTRVIPARICRATALIDRELIAGHVIAIDVE